MAGRIGSAVMAAAMLVAPGAVHAEAGPASGGHPGHVPQANGPARTAVEMPAKMKAHMLRNMRDHPRALMEIQDALARKAYEKAGEVAEQRLGMSAVERHGGPRRARYMPEGMQAIGLEMHQAASRFAITAQDAAATGDVRPALAGLAAITRQCVACHSAYRLSGGPGQ